LEAIIENEVLEKVDHKYLNDVFDFNPTCEMIGLGYGKRFQSRYKYPVHLGKTGALGNSHQLYNH